METKTLGGRKILIRKVSKGDILRAKPFLDFVNSVVEEDAKISINKKLTLKDEKDYLRKTLESIEKKRKVYLIAECDGQVVGSTDIELGRFRQNHIGGFGIMIRGGYRGIGLGTCLMREILKLAKKELRPAPKIINLSVCANNKPAIGLYKKMGFKAVARIPKQLQYKGKLIDEVVMLLYLK